MKIAIVGCGALGSFYGAKLCASGADVHFLLRSDYEVVKREGVFIRSVDGDFRVRPHCAKDPESIGVCDLVLIGLKTTANSEFGRLLPPLIGSSTAVLTLQNGLGNEEQLAAILGPERVLGGLCFVCLNRLAPGVIHHLGQGNVTLGEYCRHPQKRTRQLVELFCQAGIRCEVTDDLDRAHWEKLLWNIPFNGLGVGAVAGLDAVLRGHLLRGPLGRCWTTQDLLEDPNWASLIRELMAEVSEGAGKLGFNIPGSFAEALIERTRGMGPYKASTLLDYEQGKPLELKSLFAEPLRRASRAGAGLPRLAALASVLTELDLLKRVAVE